MYKKGQSTIEFVILATAVVLGIIVALPTFRNAISNYMNNVAGTIETTAGEVK